MLGRPPSERSVPSIDLKGSRWSKGGSAWYPNSETGSGVRHVLKAERMDYMNQ